MNIHPLSNRVVVERLDAQEKSAGGILIPERSREKPQRGKVIRVGPGLRDDDGCRIKMDVKEGDVVLFTAYAGHQIKDLGDNMLVMREDDILGVVIDP
jgi:chaperonin GroES